MSSQPQLSIRSLSLFFVVFAFSILLTTWYISAEHVFYWWDHALYMDIAVRLSRMFVQDPVEALRAFYSSTRFDYNYYFALPLIPFLVLSNYYRLGFILALVLVYHLPMLVVSGKIARQVFPTSPSAAWTAIFIGLSVPALWATVFRGLPDAGGVLLVGMAVLVYLQDMELKRWYAQLPWIGLFAGLSIIFRRHFAYSVAAFLSAVVFFLTYFAVRRAGWKGKDLLREGWGIVVKMQILVAFLVLTVALLAPGLVVKMTVLNYFELYSSYEKPPFEVLVYFFSAYGILWLFAVSGFLIHLVDSKMSVRVERVGTPDRISLGFCFVFGILEFLIWVLIPRQLNLHYLLHVSLLIVLGVSSFFLWASGRFEPHIRRSIIFSLGCLLGFNLWAGLTPNPPLQLSTTQNYPPLYREDYEEVVRLVAHLRELARDDAKIFVVDSSQIMNSKILRNAEAAAFGERAFLDILFAPEIDSRDFYPLENLINADYVILTDPLQYHLRADEQ
jgi:hypothetical protein